MASQELMEKKSAEKEMGRSVQQTISKYGIVLALIVLCIALTAATPNFMTVDNVLNVLRQVSINGILAIGMTFVVITGGIDLSVGSLVAVSGVIVASVIRSGYNMWICMAIAIAASLVLGCINGFFVAKQKLAPFIVTLAMMTIGRGLTYVISDGKPISPLTQQYMSIGKGDFLAIPNPVWILLVTYLIAYFILNKTSIGRYIYAVGGNEHAALVSGINVARIKIFVYTISGFLAGLAAIVLSARVSAGLPQAGQGYELDAIAAVVIGGTSLSGGKGRLWGTLVGILIIGVISNGLDLLNVSSYYQQIVKGCIILGAVLIDRSSNKQ